MPEDANQRRGPTIQYTRAELWSFYFEGGTAERHLNTVQERYRILASTWLLATVAAAVSTTVVIVVIRLSPQSRAVLESQVDDDRARH